MHDLNGALLLNVTSFYILSFLLPASAKRYIVLFRRIYISLQLHKSDLNIEVLNLIFLLTEYCPLDISFTSIHFLVTNFDAVEPVIKIFCDVPNLQYLS